MIFFFIQNIVQPNKSVTYWKQKTINTRAELISLNFFHTQLLPVGEDLAQMFSFGGHHLRGGKILVMVWYAWRGFTGHVITRYAVTHHITWRIQKQASKASVSEK